MAIPVLSWGIYFALLRKLMRDNKYYNNASTGSA
ncbi:hypothetical protein M2373_000222 [Chryseobacterium sp. JUb7]|nr:hypothetical protein [Chryseobacterium sp. JUb7]